MDLNQKNFRHLHSLVKIDRSYLVANEFQSKLSLELIKMNKENSPSSTVNRLLGLGLTILLLAGLISCGQLPNGRGWGQDVTLAPGWAHLGQSALGAAKEWETWGPASLALTLAVTKWDKKASNWASRENPIFDSRINAGDWSHDLRKATSVAFFATSLLTPSGKEPGTFIFSKFKGIAIGMMAGLVVGESRNLIKRPVNRTRPDGGPESFPSGHTAAASVRSTFATRNLYSLMPPGITRTLLEASFYTLSFLTGQARVEANVHYYADIMGGLALGHFVGAWFYDAFLGISPQSSQLVGFSVDVYPAQGLSLSWSY